MKSVLTTILLLGVLMLAIPAIAEDAPAVGVANNPASASTHCNDERTDKSVPSDGKQEAPAQGTQAKSDDKPSN